MQQIGVMAVVEGLAGFTSDINKIGGLLDMLRPKATILQDAFAGFGESISSFGERVMHVAEIALGVLLRDAIRWAIDGLKELAGSVIDAASDFQLLEMRLMGLNVEAAMTEKVFLKGATATEKYGQAMQYAELATSKQLNWVLKLAAVTPYDATDIARIFTMATSYGFAAKESQRLTENTMDFAAAMGLESESMERIMVNFGQMIQRGKVTTREMNDLARGSMLPIADVLEIMAKRMGISVQKLTEEISKPGGIAAENFIEAFNEMIETGVRYEDASERMARTYAGAMENIKQTTRDLFGFFIAQPVLDVLGKKLADFLDAFTSPKNWERLTGVLGRIGTGISDIVTGLFDLGPSTEDVVDKVIGFFERIAKWIENNKIPILNFFTDLKELIGGLFTGGPFSKTPEGKQPGTTVYTPGKPMPTGIGAIDWEKETRGLGTLGATPTISFDKILTVLTDIRNFIVNDLIPAFDRFKNWLTENKTLIDEFVNTLGLIVSGIFNNLMGNKTKGGGGDFLGALSSFMEFVVNNKDSIISAMAYLIKLFGYYIITATVSSMAINGLLNLITGLGSMSVGPGMLFLIYILGELPKLQSTLAGIDWVETGNKWAEDLTTKFMAALKRFLSTKVGELYSSFSTWGNRAAAWFITDFLGGLGGIGTKITNAIRSALSSVYVWSEGKTVGENIVSGIAAGISSAAGAIYNAIAAVVRNMLAQIAYLLKSHSPSMVMFDIGKDVIGEGLIQGIEAFVGPATATMANAMQSVISAASPAYSMAPSSVSTAYNTNNTFNLAINSRARTEQVIQDFNMMQSMAGV